MPIRARSFVDQIDEELLHARVTRLTEPEDRLLAQVSILLVLGDLEHFVDRRRLALTLRQNEDDLLLHIGIVHPVIELCQLRNRNSNLARPEQGFLPQLDVFLRIERNVYQPLIVAGALLLRQREQNLLLQILVAEPRIERPQELGILARAALAQPENRLLAQVGRFALS